MNALDDSHKGIVKEKRRVLRAVYQPACIIPFYIKEIFKSQNPTCIIMSGILWLLLQCSSPLLDVFTCTTINGLTSLSSELCMHG